MKKTGVHKIEEMQKLSKADLHIHTNHSDGRPTVQEVLDYVEEKTDLDVIAISDHDTMDGYFEAVELMKKKKYRFELIPSMEITSKEGHILGLFIKEPVKKHLEAHTTIKRIREQGGFPVAAHPLESTRIRNPHEPMMDGVGIVTLVKEDNGWGAIETVNATPTLGGENIKAAFVNRTMLFRPETGSSDAHIVEAIGKGYTLFEGKTAEEFKHALKHHQTQAMYDKWTLYALIKYAFFFLPIGLRMLMYTIFHGRSKARPESIIVK